MRAASCIADQILILLSLNRNSLAQVMPLEQMLSERRDEILALFVREVERKDLPPPGLSQSVLMDHIPIFLEEIAAELSRSDGPRPSLEAVEVNASARRHGGQRFQIGYDLQAVVREYGVLAHAIFEVARAANVVIANDEADILARYLNLGVAGATEQYVRFQEDRLKARQADLKFLSQAGELLGSSLDYQSTLSRLTRLLVPRLADFCVVHLHDVAAEEVPIAHVNPEKLDLIRAILIGFPLSDSIHSHAQVVRTGQALLVSEPPPGFLETIARTPEHLALLKQLAPCSWLIVPLKIQTSLFGTMTLACSDSGRHYTPADLLLAEDLARRAAAAIDNARLYEMSRDERARAQAATRTKDEFVAMVSHELRTPLNVIIGWVRLLRAGSLPDRTREHALEVVERNANAQSQLVADLLDISRAIAGTVRLDPAQVDLSNLIRLVLEDARVALEAKRIVLHTDLTPEPSVIRGDAERLQQVVWNVLTNAIKFTPKDGKIWVTLRRVDSDLELVVQDSGSGISAEFLPYVFDSFRQSDSKTTRAHRGLGIGLSITKHLVELHGGSVEAYSDGEGQGARFIVRLPISTLLSTTLGLPKVPATAPRPSDLRDSNALAGTHILVVDDERDARELLRVVLESCGAHVHEAATVREALSQIDAEPIELVLSDIGMPNEDGYTLIRTLRSHPDQQKAGIPAVALTAFARNEDRTRALLQGFNVHVTKPVEPAELLVTLGDLRKQRTRQRT
jgi:signal transduction histidine kinase/CheY-like chemotaxis protein